MASQPVLLAIMGPTASGKTALAEALADALGWQLINADAFQVYRGMDIGTAKSSRKGEYRLVDLLEPFEPFGAGAWIERCVTELESLYADGRSAILVGGTLYYIRALMEGYTALHSAPEPGLRERLNSLEDEELLSELQRRAPDVASRIDPQNRVRVQRALERLDSEPQTFSLPPFRHLKLGLERRDRSLIRQRVEAMIREGWLEEVEALRANGLDYDAPGMRAHGYRAMWRVLEGSQALESAIEMTASEVNQYAKRQRTWLRSEPNLVQLPATDEGSALATALDIVRGAN